MVTGDFHPLIKSWFRSRYGSPTDGQKLAWEKFSANKHFILSSPTGSGKTLAAFLGSLNNFISGKWSVGALRVLYISPLKALNNDIRNNLAVPLEELEALFAEKGLRFPEIRTAVRSGDSSPSERQKISRNPPEILITTPESLNLMISSPRAVGIFKSLELVILDELHVLMPEKRGTHLASAVERLVPLAGEFQRIGLSATVRPLEKAADFLGGYELVYNEAGPVFRKRTVSVIESAMSKEYDISIGTFPGAGSDPGDESWMVNIVGELKSRISAATSTLIFTSSRRMTEKITRMINEGEPSLIATAHHGSLSRELRRDVEKRMKEGLLKAIVATGSLELGIDIGALDQVLMVEAPMSIASGIQRAGRAGHSVGGRSLSVIYPLYGKDFLYSAVCSKLMRERDIEELSVPEAPLDVLAQVITGITAVAGYSRDRLYDEVRRSYPYHRLGKESFTLVLEMLLGKYDDSRIKELTPRLSWDRIDDVIMARPGSLPVLYTSGGTIPDRGYYTLRHASEGSRIGELDEEFVWERSEGDVFTMGTQVWRITGIDHQFVDVLPAENAPAMIPFWKGVSTGRSFHYSEKLCRFMDSFATENGDRFRQMLADEYRMDSASSAVLSEYLEFQKEASGGPLPGRKRIVMEHFSDPADSSGKTQVILHTFWGGRVNLPYSFAIAAGWKRKYGYKINVFSDDDAIMINLPHAFSPEELVSLVTAENFEKLLIGYLESTGYFGGRFRENAARALLLPRPGFNRRMPLWMTRLRSRKLLEVISAFKDFPVVLETWRSIMRDDFDTAALFRLLDEISAGDIEVAEIFTSVPSPFSSGLVFQHTNDLMYRDDTPESGFTALVSSNYIREYIYGSDFLPDIPEEVISEYENKRKRLLPGYAPAVPNELLEFLKERVFIPDEEWAELVKLSGCDLSESARKLFSFAPEGGKQVLVCSAENMDYPEILAAPENNYRAEEIILHFLSFYGPVAKTELKGLLGETAAEWITEAVDDFDGKLVLFLEKDGEGLICESDSLEILLRMKRSRSRKSFSPVPFSVYPLFLAAYQGILEREAGIEGLKNRLSPLFGYPFAPDQVEKDVIPFRVEDYSPSWLDMLLKNEGLVWYGNGKKRVSFMLQGDEAVYLEGEYEGPEVVFPVQYGKYTVSDLASASGLTVKELTGRIWAGVWKGNLSADSWAPFRAGRNKESNADRESNQGSIGGRRRNNPGVYRKWKTRPPAEASWFTLNRDMSGDQLEERFRREERARQLFSRYGILFREILMRETEGFRWKDIFPVLRIMELSGEVTGGFFLKGIPGLQFAVPSVLEQLDSGKYNEMFFAVNAADPASVCGLDLEEVRQSHPARLPSTYLVYKGKKLVLSARSSGQKLDFTVGPESPDCSGALDTLKNLVDRGILNSVKVKEINNGDVFDSPYLGIVEGSGFSHGLKQMIYRKPRV